MKAVFNMVGGGFQHALASCALGRPKHVEWDKVRHDGDVSIHIDEAVFGTAVDKRKTNFAWFAESPYITRQWQDKFDLPPAKEYVLENFKYVFSCDKAFILKHLEVKYVIPTARPWVRDRAIFPKSKRASIIASHKRYSRGQQLRHTIVEEQRRHIDAYGGGYKPIYDKGEGLNDYMFSFAIENIQADGYFTERILDCFATGTIPIYWGDQTISDYFDEDGIIRFTGNNNLDLSNLTMDLYNLKMKSIKANFAKALEMPFPEDFIYINYIK
jgi:Glycosyltransferase family 10 (fucosyltransferase) C-term